MNGPNRFQETNIQGDADERPQGGSQSANQTIDKPVDAKHHVEYLRLQIGREMGVETATDPGDETGDPGCEESA